LFKLCVVKVRTIVNDEKKMKTNVLSQHTIRTFSPLPREKMAGKHFIGAVRTISTKPTTYLYGTARTCGAKKSGATYLPAEEGSDQQLSTNKHKQYKQNKWSRPTITTLLLHC